VEKNRVHVMFTFSIHIGPPEKIRKELQGPFRTLEASSDSNQRSLSFAVKAKPENTHQK